MIQNRYKGQRGRGVLGIVVYAVAALTSGCAVWKMAEVAYRFYDLRNQAVYILRSADLEPDLELRKRALALAKGAGIICAEQDIVVQRFSGRVRIELPYLHEIALPVAGRRLKLFSVPVTVTAERELLG